MQRDQSDFKEKSNKVKILQSAHRDKVPPRKIEYFYKFEFFLII